VAVTVAVPVTVTVQVGAPATPPAGISILQAADAPLSSRDTVPVSTTEPSGERVVACPDAPVAVLLNTQVIVPGPDESDADPVQVPVRSGTG